MAAKCGTCEFESRMESSFCNYCIGNSNWEPNRSSNNGNKSNTPTQTPYKTPVRPPEEAGNRRWGQLRRS